MLIQWLKLIKLSVSVMIFVALLTACGGGGGSDGKKDNKSADKTWDSMRWDQGKWQ